MMTCFRSCPQKYYKEFILGLRPATTSIDLHAGAVFSSTLERFYREVWEGGAPDGVALGRAHQTFMREWGDFTMPAKDTPKTPENMWEAVCDYIRTYPPHTDHVRPYFIDTRPTFEFSFAIPLEAPEFPRHPSGDPFVYCGRADLLGQYKGLPVIRDEKTAGRLETNWAEKWDLRAQFLGYCWAARQSGLPVDTVIVRGIIITKTLIRQVEAIKIYSDHLIDLWYKQLVRDMHRLRRCWDDGWWDFNLGDTCTAYGSCAFLPMCQSAHPERWASNYVVKRWNPLDRNPVSSVAANPASLGNAPPTTPFSDDAQTQRA